MKPACPTFVQKALLAVLLISTIGQNGCVLAPAIDSFKKAGVTKSDRMQLLAQKIRDFHESLKWKDAEAPLRFVEESHQAELRPIIQEMIESENVVDTKVISSIFSDYAFEATVRVKIKSFKVPFYIVNERTDEQSWKFDMSSGWMLLSIKPGET